MSWIFYLLIAYLIYRIIVAATSSSSGKPKRVQSVNGNPSRPAVPGGRLPHEVLEVEPDASSAEIRRAYQQKIRQYHPDRVAGAAEELRELAEKRSKEINAAYQSMMERSGDTP